MTANRGRQRLRLLILFLGLALFAWLLARLGLSNIISGISRMGVAFLWVLVISGARQALRTTAWYCAIDPAGRNVRWPELFAMRLAGEAVTDLTFLGPVLGETVKGLALARSISASYSVSSLIVENLAYNGAMLLLIVSGLSTSMLAFSAHRRVRLAMIVICALALLILVLCSLAVRAKTGLVAKTADRLQRRKIVGQFIRRHKNNLEQVETNVRAFAHKHTAELVLIVLLEVLVIVTGLLETMVILSATTGRGSWKDAYFIETVNRTVNLAFGFVPMRIGVEEGGAAMALTAIGFHAADGVVLALVRKARSIFWIVVGMTAGAGYHLWR